MASSGRGIYEYTKSVVILPVILYGAVTRMVVVKSRACRRVYCMVMGDDGGDVAWRRDGRRDGQRDGRSDGQRHRHMAAVRYGIPYIPYGAILVHEYKGSRGRCGALGRSGDGSGRSLYGAG